MGDFLNWRGVESFWACNWGCHAIQNLVRHHWPLKLWLAALYQKVKAWLPYGLTNPRHDSSSSLLHRIPYIILHLSVSR